MRSHAGTKADNRRLLRRRMKHQWQCAEQSLRDFVHARGAWTHVD